MSANAPNTITKKYKLFNDNMEEVTKEVNVAFTPAASYEEAVQRIGNNADAITKAINNHLKRMALAEAKNQVKAEGISRKAVMNFLRPFRDVAPWKDMKKSDQTSSLLAQVKQTPFMLEAIKAASAAETDEDEDGGDEE